MTKQGEMPSGWGRGGKGWDVILEAKPQKFAAGYRVAL